MCYTIGQTSSAKDAENCMLGGKKRINEPVTKVGKDPERSATVRKRLPFHTLLTLPKHIICVFIHSFVLLTSDKQRGQTVVWDLNKKPSGVIGAGRERILRPPDFLSRLIKGQWGDDVESARTLPGLPFSLNSVALLSATCSVPPEHTHSAYTHSSYLFSLCRQKTLKYVACPQNFGSFCCIFSYAIEKARYSFFFVFFFFFCTDITNGYFNWNFWHCLHLVLEWQTSECLVRPGLGWLVCSEACLNQLAAWIARLILTGIHCTLFFFFFLNNISFFFGITNKGQENTSCFLDTWLLFVLVVPFCQLTFWCSWIKQLTLAVV